MFRRHRAAPCLRRSLPWLVAAPTVFVVSLTLQRSALLLAQESPNPLEGLEIPATLEAGSQLTIESSDAMQRINEALQPRFSSQYGDATVDVTYSDSATAIQALMDKQVDLAAIGRGLTATEAQAGLQQVPVARHKIAIVTGPDNPFAGSLTIEQFAQIFRGEITNWSEVGGPDAPIVLIDRPVSSDTRQAFLNYPVFQSAPFEAAPGATTLANDSTADMVAEIGPNSIGYAIANQVLDNPAVKVLPMHDTLPDDSRYPFSQPLAYVYRASDPAPAALAYLGYAVNPENEAVIAEAQAAAVQAVAPETPAADATTEATPSAESTTTPAEAATTADPTVAEEATGMEQETVATTDSAATVGATQLTWWPWLLAIPVLGGLLWWLLKGAAPVAAPLAATDTAKRRIILTPRNCRDAYAYWELPESEVAALKRQNYNLALKLHDVTDIDNVDQQAPHRTQPFDCDTVAVGDRHLPVTVDNRDYLVEMGYLDGDRQWHALARSAPVRVPACPSLVNPAGNSAGVGAAAAAAAGLGAAGLGAASLGAATMGSAAVAKPASIPVSGRAVITPRDCRNAYAYWELPPRSDR
jgi:phosphate transport system substrate-binding protein